MDWIATDANASLISKRSMSSGVSPSRLSAFALALDGCDCSEGVGTGHDAVRSDFGQHRGSKLLRLGAAHHQDRTAAVGNL
jgi:hypothetical protein